MASLHGRSRARRAHRDPIHRLPTAEIPVRVYRPDGAGPHASPLRAPSLEDLPPAIVVTAEFDILRDEGRRYADRLEAAGIPVVRHHYEATIHGFLWMGAVVDECHQMLRDVAAALRGIW